MRAGYYLKLSIFLLLAAIGGLLGAMAGAIAGYALGPLVAGLFGSISRDIDPIQVLVLAIRMMVIAGFLWAFLKSYTYLVRRFW